MTSDGFRSLQQKQRSAAHIHIAKGWMYKFCYPKKVTDFEEMKTRHREHDKNTAITFRLGPTIHRYFFGPFGGYQETVDTYLS